MLDLITKTGSGLAIFCLVACIFTFARVRFVEVLFVLYSHLLESCTLFNNNLVSRDYLSPFSISYFGFRKIQTPLLCCVPWLLQKKISISVRETKIFHFSNADSYFFYRGLSAIRYRIHINLCVALVAAQLVFVTGIHATEIKVGELLPLKLKLLTDETNSWTVVKLTKGKKTMQKKEIDC